MRNKIVLSLCFFSISYGFAQTGLGAKLPFQLLHIDAKKNNPVDRTVNATEIKDDFVVTKEGNVGIGVINPTAKLEIDGVIRLKDGSEGENKILMSDSQGVAHWEKVPYDIPTFIGEFESTNKVIWNGGEKGDTHTYVNYKINLTKGRWVVNLGLVVNMKSTYTWLLAVVSTSKIEKQQNGFKFITVAEKSTAYAAYLRKGFGVITGSSIIEVLDDNITLYVLVRKNGNWEFDPLGEQNFLYATPVL